MRQKSWTRIGLTIPLLLLFACSEPPSSSPTSSAPSASSPETPKPEAAPADVWWEHLTSLCGQAFAGTLTSEDPTDAALAEQSMAMHVRRCDERRLEIPFHIGENRSRTWVLTRTDQGLKLQHDHRHEDGSEDEVTLYGGTTDNPNTEATQHFPADDYSKQLFETNGLKPSIANVWTMEVIPGERFSYILRRPKRYFQADFDLTRPIEPPPSPWGHE